jgi:hypothetical protein
MDLQYHTLTRLYIIADSLLDSITANLVIDEIAFLAWTWQQAPGTEVIHVAFGSTREHDGLRNLLADLHAQLYDRMPEGDLPNAFLGLIFERFLAAKENEDIVVRDELLERIRDVGNSSAWTRREYHQLVPCDEVWLRLAISHQTNTQRTSSRSHTSPACRPIGRTTTSRWKLNRAI